MFEESLTYVSFVYVCKLCRLRDCGLAVARTIKAFDARGIFRDVYIKILCKLCRLRTAVALDLRRAWAAGYSEV